jgi:hypothetical protein
MAFIKQKLKTDCGVAALAMLCNAEYEDAMRAIPWRRHGHSRGTDTKQIKAGAYALGYEGRGDRLQVIQAPKGWVEKHGSEIDYRIWTFIPDNSLVKVPGDGRSWHWVAWRKGKVYDPEIGVFGPKAYNEIFHLRFPSSYMQFVPEGTEDCPKCGTPTEAQWSGIKCPECGWRYCS